MSPSLSWTCGPNNPDLNPVDYAMLFGALKERIYHGRKFDIVDPMQAIVLEWRALPRRFTDHSIFCQK